MARAERTLWAVTDVTKVPKKSFPFFILQSNVSVAVVPTRGSGWSKSWLRSLTSFRGRLVPSPGRDGPT
jgi:hypothetical protein